MAVQTATGTTPCPECLAEVLPEIPFYVAAYEARRRGLPPEPAPSPPPAAWRRR